MCVERWHVDAKLLAALACTLVHSVWYGYSCGVPWRVVCLYILVGNLFFLGLKRKINGDIGADMKKTSENELLSDLIVLGLPYATTDEDLKIYFEKYGELQHYEVSCITSCESIVFTSLHMLLFLADYSSVRS